MARIESQKYKLKNGKDLIIRTGVNSDATAMRDCVIAYIDDNTGQLWDKGEFAPSVEDEIKWIATMLDNPNELLLVAEVDGAIVGNIDFHIGARKRLSHAGEFGMSVLPKWRGQGIGSLLLSNLLAWARSNPAIEKVNLRVISNNEAGLSLYRKLGFKEEGRKLKEVKYGNNKYADDIHMGLFVD